MMKKILVVDDEPSVARVLADELSGRGYVVSTAANGKLGLEKAINERSDLVILDVKMPVMDGLAMLESLRSQEFGKEMKVIILSNLEPDDSIITKVYANLPIAYFIKSDIALADLLEKVDEVLQV